ncbi:MAG: hypothetical protein KJ069_02890 [Anaerolineae bacterium]|nr:hypothetical protein [Anaerolineae bacterium]
MKRIKFVAVEVTLLLLAVLFLSSFVWYPRQPAVTLNPVHDPVLADVAETTDSLDRYAKWAAAVPAEAKLDYAYAYPWLVKDKEAATRPYSDALALRYAQQNGNRPPAPPEQAPLMDLTYPQQYGNWPQTH